MAVVSSERSSNEREERDSRRSRPSRQEPSRDDTRIIVVPFHTAVKGRVRFRVPLLHRVPWLAGSLVARLSHYEALTKVSANSLTSTVLVLYAPSETIAGVQALITATLAGILEIPSDATAASSGRPSAKWCAENAECVLAEVGSSREGLSDEEAKRRLASEGANSLPQVRPRSGLAIFAEQLKSVPVALLAGAAGLSLATGGVSDALIIAGVVLANAAIGYVTESGAEHTIYELTQVKEPYTTVWRAGRARRVRVEDVVRGDVLVLGPGRISADARLLKAKVLSVDESALTGESLPVVKHAETLCRSDAGVGDQIDMVFRDTVVTGGSGLGVVVATGQNTEIGKIQALIGSTHPPATPLQKQLETLGRTTVALSGGVCLAVLGIGLARGLPLGSMLKSSIALAVAAVPEGLPTLATTTLAFGVRRMQRRKVLVRRLSALETLGATQVLCLDKTGTMTLNRMSVLSIVAGMQNYAVEDGRLEGLHNENAALNPSVRQLLEVLALCNESEVKDIDGKRRMSGSATENALLGAALDAGIDVAKLRRAYPLIKVEARNELRSFMGTIHDMPGKGRFLAVKGNPADILALCGHYRKGEDTLRLSPRAKAIIEHQNEALADRGLRVLGVAYMEADSAEAIRAVFKPTTDSKPALEWLGLVGLADPLRQGMPKVIDRLHQAGIDAVMITGDQSATARAIGRDLGLNGSKPPRVFDGRRLENATPDELSGAAANAQVFARVSPSHKLKIVDSLQRAGKVVGMTGDGINDGPALKAADVGVAMGACGSNVAREIADIVLEEDNVHDLLAAIAEGRAVYDNIKRAVRYIFSSNLSEILVMLGGISFGLGQPLNAKQLLWINLMTDVLPEFALALAPPERDIMTRPPRSPNESLVSRRDAATLATQGGVITACALAAYALAVKRYGQGARAGTIAFTSLTTGQLLQALITHAESKSEGAPDRYLVGSIAVGFAVQLLAVLVPGFRPLLGTEKMGAGDMLLSLVAGSLAFFINYARISTKKQTTFARRITPLLAANTAV